MNNNTSCMRAVKLLSIYFFDTLQNGSPHHADGFQNSATTLGYYVQPQAETLYRLFIKE